jgi:phosphatidylglycerol---prolipoprotein diacylglyceryl transferase
LHPSFGEVLGEPIPAYFTLLMVGFGLAIWSVVRWGKREGLDHQSLIDAGLASILGGVLGGRLLHVLADGYLWDYVHLCTDPSLVSWPISAAECGAAHGLWDAAARVCHPVERDCLAWAKFYNGGLAYYGGLVGGTALAARVLQRDRMPLLRVIDATAPGVALGLCVGRLGCFLGGCCFGVVTEGPLGVSFPPWSPASESQFRHGLLAAASEPSLPVHPTQLYEAAGCLVISAVLFAWHRRAEPRDGRIGLAFLAGYAVLRFALEFWRADDRGGGLGLSTSQWLSVLILGAVAEVYRRWLRPARR